MKHLNKQTRALKDFDRSYNQTSKGWIDSHRRGKSVMKIYFQSYRKHNNAYFINEINYNNFPIIIPFSSLYNFSS